MDRGTPDLVRWALPAPRPARDYSRRSFGEGRREQATRSPGDHAEHGAID